MQIVKWRPMDATPSERGFVPLACFNLELVPGVVIFKCMAIRAPNGRVLIYGPKDTEAAMAVSFSPKIREAIADVVEESIGKNAYDHFKDAA